MLLKGELYLTMLGMAFDINTSVADRIATRATEKKRNEPYRDSNLITEKVYSHLFKKNNSIRSAKQILTPASHV